MNVMLRLLSLFAFLFVAPFKALLGLVERHVFPQLDHRVSADLDLMARASQVIGKQASRARSFVTRCLTHDLFGAGRFDPDRIPT